MKLARLVRREYEPEKFLVKNLKSAYLGLSSVKVTFVYYLLHLRSPCHCPHYQNFTAPIELVDFKYSREPVGPYNTLKN